MRVERGIQVAERSIADIVSLPSGVMLISSLDGGLDRCDRQLRQLRSIRPPAEGELLACRIIHADEQNAWLWGWESVRRISLQSGAIDPSWGNWDLEGSHSLDEDEGECLVRDGIASLPDGTAIHLANASFVAGLERVPYDDVCRGVDERSLLYASHQGKIWRVDRDGTHDVADVRAPVQGIAGNREELIVALPHGQVRRGDRALTAVQTEMPRDYLSHLAAAGEVIVHLASWYVPELNRSMYGCFVWRGERLELETTWIDPRNEQPAPRIATGDGVIVVSIDRKLIRVTARGHDVLDLAEHNVSAIWTDAAGALLGTREGKILLIE